MGRNSSPRRVGRSAGPTAQIRATAQPTAARSLAYECLERCRKRDGFARDILDRMLDECSLDSKDRAFATVLVLGVTSAKGTLDGILDGCMRSPADVNDDVRTALRISAYEILFLGKPPHVSVDQGVRLVASRIPRAKGLANSVLRRVAAASEDFPFGDDRSDIRAAATKNGFPFWMAERIAARTSFDDAAEFMRASNEAAPVFIAVNPIKSDDVRIEEAFASSGEEIVPVYISGERVPGCFWLPDPMKLHLKSIRRLFSSGNILVSDAASQYIAMSAARAAADAAGAVPFSCLDLCCGRGTKTVLLASMSKRICGAQPQPFIAVDNIPYKAQTTKDRAASYGVDLDLALASDILSPEFASEIAKAAQKIMPDEPRNEEGMRGFDLVFLDAPCTGTGTMRRHPEIRWKASPGDIREMARIQGRLLERSSQLVSTGGILVYSTCSAEPEEDEAVVRSFLETGAGASFSIQEGNGIEGFGSRLPLRSGFSDAAHPYPDAHYFAILARG